MFHKMHQNLNLKTWLPIFLAIPLFLSLGCSSTETNPDDPSSLSKEVDELVESNRYILALERLQELKNRHPYSPQAIDAQLRMADIYFLQENFSEAAATYEAFRDLHPKHAKVRYSMYRAGLSYYSDIPDLRARDLTPAFKAQDAFREFLNQFPEGEFVADAKAKLSETRNAIAEKELYVANFYFRKDDWESAKGRYSKIISFYSDTNSFAEAEKKLKIVEGKLQNVRE
jgi:outer membrane protein assembly factor BamD